ncbi:MAG: 2'-deoxycytidine 5'-triphosphate deaminase [Kiloniellales bacterium]
MAEEAAQALFPEQEKAAAEPDFTTGVLPSQGIREAISRDEILATEEIAEAQIQPASLDLRLGPWAYRVRASFLPGKRATVGQKLEALSMHRIDLGRGAVLEKDCVYIAPLMESVRLRHRTSAVANPKSSTGRLDIFARVITDYGTEFDHVRAGYRGPLWAEISPRSFSVLVRTGSRLVQLRIKRGSPAPSDVALRRLHEQVGLVDAGEEAVIKKGLLAVTVDTQGPGGKGHDGAGLVGYRAKKNTDLIDIEKVGHYDPLDYWEPIIAHRNQGIVLDPDAFYILASKEAVTVPDDHAAEMIAYDTLVGEFRVHYAGFFDPGFGYAESGGEGSRAVLEIRSHDVPFILEDGQIVGRLLYERLTAKPDKLYGRDIGSSYQRQGLALAKQFRR